MQYSRQRSNSGSNSPYDEKETSNKPPLRKTASLSNQFLLNNKKCWCSSKQAFSCNETLETSYVRRHGCCCREGNRRNDLKKKYCSSDDWPFGQTHKRTNNVPAIFNDGRDETFSRREMLWGPTPCFSQSEESRVRVDLHKNRARRAISSAAFIAYRIVLTLFGFKLLDSDVDNSKRLSQCEHQTICNNRKNSVFSEVPSNNPTPWWRKCLSLILCAAAACYICANLPVIFLDCSDTH